MLKAHLLHRLVVVRRRLDGRGGGHRRRRCCMPLHSGRPGRGARGARTDAWGVAAAAALVRLPAVDSEVCRPAGEGGLAGWQRLGREAGWRNSAALGAQHQTQRWPAGSAAPGGASLVLRLIIKTHRRNKAAGVFHAA